MKKLKWFVLILVPIIIIVLLTGSIEYFLHHAKFSFQLSSGNVDYIKNEEVDGIWENYNGDIHFHLKEQGTTYEVENKRKSINNVYIPAIVDQTYIKNRRKLSKEEILKLGDFQLEEIENKTYYIVDEVKLVYKSNALTDDIIHSGKYEDGICFKETPKDGAIFVQCIEKNQSGEYTSFYHIDKDHKVELMDNIYDYTQDQESNNYRITRKKDKSFPSCIYKEQDGLLTKIVDLPNVYTPYDIYANKSYIYISCTKNDVHCILKYAIKGKLLKEYNCLPMNIRSKKIENVYQNDEYMIILNSDEVIIYDEKRNQVIKTYNRNVFESKLPSITKKKSEYKIQDMVFKNNNLYILESQFKNDFNIELYVYHEGTLVCNGNWNLMKGKKKIEGIGNENYNFQIRR